MASTRRRALAGEIGWPAWARQSSYLRSISANERGRDGVPVGRSTCSVKVTPPVVVTLTLAGSMPTSPRLSVGSTRTVVLAVSPRTSGFLIASSLKSSRVARRRTSAVATPNDAELSVNIGLRTGFGLKRGGKEKIGPLAAFDEDALDIVRMEVVVGGQRETCIDERMNAPAARVGFDGDIDAFEPSAQLSDQDVAGVRASMIDLVHARPALEGVPCTGDAAFCHEGGSYASLTAIPGPMRLVSAPSFTHWPFPDDWW